MKTVKLYNDTRTIQYNPDGHGYRIVEKDKNAPGVTQILAATFPKDAIGYWMLNTGLAYVDKAIKSGRFDYDAILAEAKGEHRRVSTEAKDKGTIVHDFCEKYPHASIPTDPQAAKACRAYVAWYKEHKVKPLGKETILYSDQHFYAGTVDFHGLIDDQFAVLDFKTSSGLYREMPLQIAAYAVALEEMHGARIDHGWVIRLDKKTAQFEAHYIPITRKLKDEWIDCLRWYRALQHLDDLTEQVRDATKNGRRLSLTVMTQALAQSLEI